MTLTVTWTGSHQLKNNHTGLSIHKVYDSSALSQKTRTCYWNIIFISTKSFLTWHSIPKYTYTCFRKIIKILHCSSILHWLKKFQNLTGAIRHSCNVNSSHAFIVFSFSFSIKIQNHNLFILGVWGIFWKFSNAQLFILLYFVHVFPMIFQILCCKDES